MQQNVEIRMALKNNRVKYWEVANRLGIADTTFSRWLRKELSVHKKREILIAINEIKQEIKSS